MISVPASGLMDTSPVMMPTSSYFCLKSWYFWLDSAFTGDV